MKLNLSKIISMLALGAAGICHATYSWGPSGLDGSGEQVCLAVQPGGTGVVISAGDVSGFLRSTDLGQHWRVSNAGIRTSAIPNTVSAAFDPYNTNTVYGAIKEGLYVSTDAGQSWNKASTAGNAPTFTFGGSPRSTGNLLGFSKSGSTEYIFAGGLNGLSRSTDGGVTWTNIGSTDLKSALSGGAYILSIVVNPTSGSDLFVAVSGHYIFHCSGAQNATVTDADWTDLNGTLANPPPATPEELAFIGGNLYAAGTNSGSGGVWKSTNSGRTTWTKLSGVDTSPNWTAITGYNNGTNDIIYIGADNPVAGTGGQYRTVLRSMDGGSTWFWITQSGCCPNEIGGPGGPPWWMGQPGGNASYLLNGSNGDVFNLALSSDHGTLLTAGHGGIWASTNPEATTTTSSSSVRFYPYVAGLNVAVAECLAFDSNRPGVVYAGDEDRTFFWSTDHGTSWRMHQPSTGGTTSFAIAVDPKDSSVYCSNQDPSAGTGKLFSNPDPTAVDGSGNLVNAWTDLNFLSSAGANAGVQGLAVGYNGSGQRVILAAAQSTTGHTDNGIYRSVAGGSFSRVSSGPSPSGWVQDGFAWNPGSAVVYLCEPTTGVWRSSDYGSTWSNIYALSGGGYGFICVDPTNDATVYVVSGGGVHRLTNATGTPTDTAMGGPDAAHGIAMYAGMLYAADHSNSSHDGRMFLWTSPSTSTTSSLISDSTMYPGAGGWVNCITVDPSGFVLTNSNGDAVMTGATNLLLTDDFEDGSTSGWTVDSGTWSIGTNGTKVYQVTSSAGGISHSNASGSSSWTDIGIQADITPLTGNNVGLCARFVDTNNRYYVQLIATGTGSVSLKKKVAGTETILNTVSYPITDGTTYTVKFIVVGNRLQVYINGVLVNTTVDSASSIPAGTVALTAYNSTCDFDNVLVTGAY